MQARLNVDADWWNSRRNKDDVFSTIYFRGDDSLEGRVQSEELCRDERTRRECRGVLQLLRPLSGHNILDCPCGQGRHSLFFSESSQFDMTGVDLCAEAINQAREQAARKKLGCKFLVGDMREIPVQSNSFDYVLDMFFSFGFFAEKFDNIKVAKEFHRVLRPEGRLLIHTDVNPSLLERGEYWERCIRTLRDGSELKIQEHFVEEINRLEGSWIIRDTFGRLTESKYSIRIYSHSEMETLLKSVGFREVVTRVFPPSLNTTLDDAQEIAYIAVK